MLGSPFGESLPLSQFSPAQHARTAEDVTSLGVALGPGLREACGDRLGEIEWFQSPWQRSGAATGRTWWRLPDGSVIRAIAKVPVGYREYFWTTRLGEVSPMRYETWEAAHLPVPRVLASGLELGGYDVAWMITERVPGETLNTAPTRRGTALMFEAASTFHAMAEDVRAVSETEPHPEPDWRKLIERARQAAEEGRLPLARRWASALASAERRLEGVLRCWAERERDTWCHGDLHPGNMMVRSEEPARGADGRSGGASGGGPREPGAPGAPSAEAEPPADAVGVLLDLALVQPGAWFEDALYCERVHWGREDRLFGVEPVEALSRARAERGLGGDVRAADATVRARRVMVSAASPALLSREGDDRYIRGALERLEGSLEGLG